MSRQGGCSYRISSPPLIPLVLQGVRSPVVGSDVHTKSNLDNIVGSLWQARQESSGSSVGNQVIRTFSILPTIENLVSPTPVISTIFYLTTIQVIGILGRVTQKYFPSVSLWLCWVGAPLVLISWPVVSPYDHVTTINIPNSVRRSLILL